MRFGHPIRLLETASFRLAALYALIFGASVVALGVIVYLHASDVIDAQLRAGIETEIADVENEYREGGLEHLREDIAARERSAGASHFAYGVFDGAGQRLMGTMPSIALGESWSQATAPGSPAGGVGGVLLVRVEPLSNGHWVAVGGDLDRADQLKNAILASFGWALALTVTLGIVGGLVVSSAFLGRVDDITRTAEAIIEGDMQRRIPRTRRRGDLDRLAATLNRMLDRIAVLMESLKQVSSDIAHDLRTPLGRLRQGLEEARQSHATPEDYGRAIDRAMVETDAILDTFAALLRIAQVESGTRRAGFRPTDLSAVVETVADAFSPAAEDAEKTFETRIAPGLQVDGDQALLVQMVANLVENAIRHTHPGARIEVALAAGEDGAVLSVSDDGPGVAEADRARIFRRFYRPEQSRSTPGSGLGLSLSGAIAELHGTRIELGDNAPGLRASIRFAVLARAPGAG